MVHCWHFRLQMSTFACLTLLFTKLASHCLENQHENYECIGILPKRNCMPKMLCNGNGVFGPFNGHTVAFEQNSNAFIVLCWFSIKTKGQTDVKSEMVS